MRPVVGHSLFQISLRERKQEVERIPWVESATVMRLWPNRLRVAVRERAPVAFVSLGGQISLIDSNGVLMEMPNSGTSYSFPVILGMGDDEPLSTRAARMKIFMRLIRELDGEGSKMQYSRQLSEVDLSDADDVKVTAHGSQGDILLHLGSSEFLPKFMVFLANVQKWQQEHGKLESVDLRFGSQVILKSAELPPLPKPESKPAAKPAASRAAAAGAHGVEKKRK
jgi:cell division protein FtsQ